MIPSIPLSSLFYGLVGALIVVVTTIGLYWHGRYSSTRRALIDRLNILKHDVYWNCDESDVFKTWDSSLKEIWGLYNAFSDFAGFRKKRRIRIAWEAYKGENREILKNLKGQVIDSKSPPKNKDEFLHKIDSFIKVL